MAMMISKFHKLIQSRILWGAFLIVIVFSFVIWGMVWPSQMDRADRVNAAGMLDGEPVTHGEFRAAYIHTYLARALTSGRDLPSTPENDALLRRISWQRLATLREAARLGITVSEDELVGVIRANFAGQDRTYDPQQYQNFLQNTIRPMGFTPAQFEQHVREEIIMQKLGSLIGRQAHVTPLEIQRTFETLLDTFTVEYATILAEDIEKTVEIGEADARTLYDADPAVFTLPEQREVSLAAFPLAEHRDEQEEVAEDDILDFYELHIQDYTRQEQTEDGETREVVEDLETVREEIVAALRREAALARADAAAAELAFRAIPDRDGRVPDFTEEAAKAGKTIQKLAPFSRSDLPVEDAGAVLTAVAFELDLNAFDRVSAPVAGEENVYVLYLEQIHAPRVPSFEEARADALAAARQRAVRDAIQARALAVQEAAMAGLAQGQTFADSIRSLGVQAETTEPFTGLSGSASTNDAIQALVQAVVAYNPGEVTDPVPADDGLIVGYLLDRVAGDPATFDTYRDEIAAAIRNRRAQGLFHDWQTALLAPDRFTDLQRPSAADDLEEDADWDDADAITEEL
jgi:peptidyl-prolyl cis-trans isomerase D